MSHRMVGWWTNNECRRNLRKWLWHNRGISRNVLGMPVGTCLEIREYGRRDPSRWPRGTFYPQKLALTSSTSGGCSVGIVRSRTQATEVYAWGKPLKNLSQDSRKPGPDLNRAPSEQRIGALTLNQPAGSHKSYIIYSATGNRLNWKYMLRLENKCNFVIILVMYDIFNKTKLRCFNTRANYTDCATVACRRS
jgi:hypothetical protein